MKKVYTAILVAIGLAMVLPSCQKAPELTLTGPASLEISADGSSNSITFTANRDWSVRSSESWVSISPSSGTASDGTVTVSIRCNENTTYEDRSATITISMEELSQTVTVRQPANLGIVIPTRSYDLASDARSIEVEVQSNVQYTVSISDNWIKQTGTKGLTTSKLIFSVDENTTYDARSATITIKPQNATVQEQVISVKQAQKDALTVEKTSFDMPYGGGEIEVKVEANVSFDVKPSVDWIHYVETKALSSSTVRLTVDENATYSNREGKIEIKQKDGTLSHTLTVKQAERKLEAVDLGLSVKWAPINLGATSIGGIGDYYAWGEVENKAEFTWRTYKWCDGTQYYFTKYVHYNDSDIQMGSSFGVADNLLQLENCDDVAYTILGDGWRMPTSSEVTELFVGCSVSEESLNGIDVFRLTSVKNGASIVIPKAGYMEVRDVKYNQDYLFWSASYYIWGQGGAGAYAAGYFSTPDIYGCTRCYGLQIRPVFE